MITPVLRVHDIDLSLTFYRQILGFSGAGGLPGSDGKTAYAEAYLGDAHIMFSRRCERAPLTCGVELYLTLPDTVNIDTFYALLKAREVYFIADMHRELWGDCAFTIIDFDGNRLTFAQAQRYPVHVDTVTFEQIA
jgi:uncharacterized glyoxalase superfamily protein PhnB